MNPLLHLGQVSLVFTLLFGQHIYALVHIDAWGSTTINAKKTTTAWKLSNFSLFNSDKNKPLKSPTFYDKNEKDISWFIKLSSENDLLKIIVNFRIKVKLEKVLVRVSLLDRNDKLYFLTPEHTLNSNNELVDFETINTVHQVNLYHQNYFLLPEDTLTIVVEFSYKNEYKEYPSGNCKAKRWITSDYIGNINHLVETEQFPFFSFKVQGGPKGFEVFTINPLAIVSISEVFKLKVSRLLMESKNTLVITDITPDTFRKILFFAYTGKVNNIEKIAHELITVAEKYKIRQLRDVSEKALCSMDPRRIDPPLVM